jgi:predicted ribosomally synthesized peptide with nif11-like leader
MAGHGVEEFSARLKTDPAFRAEVSAAEVGEDRLAFVNGAGYDVSAQELVDAMSALADADLDGVQGGLDTSPVPYFIVDE